MVAKSHTAKSFRLTQPKSAGYRKKQIFFTPSIATKIQMKSKFSMSDCNIDKKLSQLTVKINARSKGPHIQTTKPVSSHVDMHSIAKSHFDEAVS